MEVWSLGVKSMGEWECGGMELGCEKYGRMGMWRYGAWVCESMGEWECGGMELGCVKV